MTLAVLRSKMAWLSLLLGTCVLAVGCGEGEGNSSRRLESAPTATPAIRVREGETLTVGAGRSSFLMVTGNAESAEVATFAVTSEGLDLGKSKQLGSSDSSDPKIRLMELADASWLIGQRVCTESFDNSGCGERATRFVIFEPSSNTLRVLGDFPMLDEYQLLHEPSNGHVLLVGVTDVRGIPEWTYFDLDTELAELAAFDVDIPAQSRGDALGTVGCQVSQDLVVLTRSDTRSTLTSVQDGGSSIAEVIPSVRGAPTHLVCSDAGGPLLLTADEGFLRTYRLDSFDSPNLESELQLPGPLFNLSYAPGAITAVVGPPLSDMVNSDGADVVSESRSAFVLVGGTWAEVSVPPGDHEQVVAAGNGRSFAGFTGGMVRAWVR